MCPALALADDSGVLAEGELNDWIVGVLRKSAAREPLNAPVGEESRTEDGYAFIYDFATLYYDKPVLDETSVLLAVSLTSEIYPGPRNIYLGDAETVLTGTYGWQNPALAGDGVFAAFYCLDGLPQSAYWCWAQHDGKGSLTSVQCAIHVMAGEDRYTDAGVIYSLDGGVVTAIHVYGLSSFITGSEVGSNLEAVRSVEDAAQGVSVTVEAASVPLSGAAPFGAGDLRFSGLDYAALTLEGAREALGAPVAESAAQDESGATYVSLRWEGAELIWLEEEGGGRAQSLRVTGTQNAGPRGLKAGMGFEEASALFLSEGGPGVLYGAQGDAQYAEARSEGTQTIVSYYTSAGESGGSYVLQLVFENGALKEWVLSTSERRLTL